MPNKTCCLPFAWSFLWLLGTSPPLFAEANRPHIVIFLADDLGMGNLTAYRPQSNIPTPEISRMAREGCCFWDVHSASAVCTPSRYALLTGRHPFRSRLSESVLFSAYDPPLLDGEPETIAGMLQRAGYHTAAFGKWHLGADFASLSSASVSPASDSASGIARAGVGSSMFTTRDVDFTKPIRHLPVDHGFHYFFGLSSSLNHDPYAFVENDRLVSIPTKFRQQITTPKGGGPFREGWVSDEWDDAETCPRILDRAIKHIRTALASQPDQPLFLYYASPAPHFPWVPPATALGRAVHGAGGNDDNQPRHNDMVVMNDVEVGGLRNALEDPNGDGDFSDSHLDRTLFIITSDNGASAGECPPFRGKKGAIHEGGHRVPFIVRWPGQVAAGSRSDALFGHQDLYATLAALTRNTVVDDAATDSRNVLAAIRGDEQAETEQLTQRVGASSEFALRDGNWKLIIDSDQKVNLFDLSSDVGETTEMSDQHPARVRAMRARLTTIIEPSQP